MIMSSIVGNITLIIITGSIMGNITLIMIMEDISKFKKTIRGRRKFWLTFFSLYFALIQMRSRSQFKTSTFVKLLKHFALREQHAIYQSISQNQSSCKNHFLYYFRVLSDTDSTVLPAGIYLFKVQNNVWNKFKVNNIDTRTTSMTSFWCLYC